MRKLKILILSYEVWRDERNGGNVLSNIFQDFNADFAQVYCVGGKPNNRLCKKYYQISDGMIMNGIWHGTVPGKELIYSDYPSDDTEEARNYKEKNLGVLYKLRWPIFLFARELMWKVANWKSQKLERFVMDFNPDVVFAPCYGVAHMLDLTLYVKALTNKPIISYISDDNYSLRHLRVSLFYWIDRFIVRRKIRECARSYSLLYAMTDMQCRECESVLHVPMKVLCKYGTFDIDTKNSVNSPVMFIYAGGLYLNRWKVLSELRKSIHYVNKNGKCAELHIYSASKLNDRQRRKLHDGVNSYLHNPVSSRELKQIYRQADVAVHVESFDLRSRLETRLSFSTKIVDCLDSGCAVLAVGPKGQAGIDYLRENDGAICITNKRKVLSAVQSMIDNPDKIIVYSKKAGALGRKNHQKSLVSAMLTNDFERIVERDESSSD